MTGPIAFPLVPSADRRYLVDQAGVPFPIMGAASWDILTSLTRSEYTSYLDDRIARGFNAIEIRMISHFHGAFHPKTAAGDLPFARRLDGQPWTGELTYGNIAAEAPDFTTPNEPYWAFVDQFLADCEAKGLLVLGFPSYVGYVGGVEGWMKEMVANGTTKMRSYGTFVATRYAARKNMVWMLAGDYGSGSTSFTAGEAAVEDALIAGMKSVNGASKNFSAELGSESTALSPSTAALTAAITLNGAYSFMGRVADYGRQAYMSATVMPAFLLEEPYDEEGPDGTGKNPASTQPVRRYIWWGWLSTIGGYVSGNGYVIHFEGGSSVWEPHLGSPGTQDLGRLNAFIRSLAWQNLVPSGLNGMPALIPAGGGTPADSGYVAAAATAAKNLLVAYVPPAHTGAVTVAMTALGGTVRARWFDPTTAAYSAAGSFPNTGTHAFTTPGKNGGGDNDWVLVLDMAP